MKILWLFLLWSSMALAAPEVREAIGGQDRVTPIARRSEVTVGVGRNYSGSGFLETSQLAVNGLYHFDRRWAVGGGYARVNNEFTPSAKSLQAKTGYLPDVDFVRQRLELRGQANLFGGRFRLTSKQDLVFDQYLALGPVYNDLRSGGDWGWMGDLGFASYFGQRVVVRFGAKDYYYRENRTLTKGYAHNVHGYLQAGLLF